MTIQSNNIKPAYYPGQYIKSCKAKGMGWVASVKPETSNVQIMGFGDKAFQDINYRLVIVWREGIQSIIQRDATEHDVEPQGFGDLTPLSIKALYNTAEEEEQKRQDLKALDDADKAKAHQNKIDALLKDPAYSHLTPSEGKYSGGVQAAKNIRQDLKKNFPGVKFSVRSSYNSLNVSWTDGPTVKAVDKIVNLYKTGRFDSYTDYHYSEYDPFNDAFGGCDYPSTSRKCSDELKQIAIDKALEKFGACEVVTLENLNAGKLWYAADGNGVDNWAREIGIFLDELETTPIKAIKQPKKPVDIFEAITAEESANNGPHLYGATLSQHTHTQKGHEMFIVSLADYVGKEVFKDLLAKARTLKGAYTRKFGETPGGYVFRSEDPAHEFMTTYLKDPGSDQPETTPESAPAEETKPAAVPAPVGDPKLWAKLLGLAESMQSKIDHALGERLTNTPKRQAQAATARLEGERMKRTQTILNTLAALAKAGSMPSILQKFKSKKSIYDLVGTKTNSCPNGYHAYYVCTGEPRYTCPDALALWDLLSPKTEEEKKADKIQLIKDKLQFSSIPGYFPTPEGVCDRMVQYADLSNGQTVSDPNGGSGAILDAVKRSGLDLDVSTYEINFSLRELLTLQGHTVKGDDFLDHQPSDGKFDRILMNPPFEKLQDIDHVQHAYTLLNPGGVLVAIVSNGAMNNSQQKAQTFQSFINTVATHQEPLASGTFKDAGTMVNSTLIVLEKDL